MENEKLVQSIDTLAAQLVEGESNEDTLAVAAILYNLSAFVLLGQAGHFSQFCREYAKEMKAVVAQAKKLVPKTTVH